MASEGTKTPENKDDIYKKAELDAERRVSELVKDHLASVEKIETESKVQGRSTTTPRRGHHQQKPALFHDSSTYIDWTQRRDSAIKLTPTRRDLPAPPSMRGGLRGSFKEEEDEEDKNDVEGDEKSSEKKKKQTKPKRDKVAVFNANSTEGVCMVRALAKTSDVVAIVRVFTNKNSKALCKIPHVTVKVADTHDEEELGKAIAGSSQAFLCTKFWEYFDTTEQERSAIKVVEACGKQGVSHMVFSSFEDIEKLKKRGEKSQITPNSAGVVHPKFAGMSLIKKKAQDCGVQLTHMLTSYLDQEHSKKSLCLIVGQNGKLIIQPHLQ